MEIELNRETQILTVDGIRMTFEFLNSLANPDEKLIHRFKRVGNRVTITSHVSLTEFHPGGTIQ